MKGQCELEVDENAFLRNGVNVGPTGLPIGRHEVAQSEDQGKPISVTSAPNVEPVDADSMVQGAVMKGENFFFTMLPTKWQTTKYNTFLIFNSDSCTISFS